MLCHTGMFSSGALHMTSEQACFKHSSLEVHDAACIKTIHCAHDRTGFTFWMIPTFAAIFEHL